MSADTGKLAAALGDRYQIERRLGEGGMATVYLAEDLKHDRKVALKVLKAELAAVLGAERFVQEIKTTASLQHPNILPLFDSGEAAAFLYYVMPYIEGETLREKLNRETQLGIDEAVQIATDVAEALQAAHEEGVIHRDIKPENILLHKGRAMVADFGIALAVSAAAGGRMTETGLSLGTPHYMSPEQATAQKDITGRSDIYSLGAVLYEMLAGHPPHIGGTAQQIISKIITEDVPPVTETRRTARPNVAAAVATALEKLPADRFESATDMATALADPSFGRARPTATGVVRGSASRWRVMLPWAVAVVVAIAWVSALGRSTSADGMVRYVNIQLPDSAPLVYIGESPGAIGHPALLITPDGQRIVYVGQAGNTTSLYVRQIDDFEVRRLRDTEGAYAPCMSPDGEAVAFFAEGLLKRAQLDGEQVVSVTEAHWAYGCSWSDDDRIVTVVGDNRELIIAQANGGAVERRPLQPEIYERSSHHEWLPSGEWLLASCVLTLCSRSVATSEIHFLSPAGVEPSGASTDRLRGSNPRFLAPDVLLFSAPADNVLLGARFDPATRQLLSQPLPLRRGVRRENAWGVIQMAVSASGDLLYAEGENAIEGRFVWADSQRVEPLNFPPRVYGAFTLSRDGRFVAARVHPVAGAPELWILDLQRNAESRWVAGPHLEGRVLGSVEWFPDSHRLMLSAIGDSSSALLAVDANAPAGGQVLWEGTGALFPQRLGPTGDAFFYVSRSDGQPPYFAPARTDSVQQREGPAETVVPPIESSGALGALMDIARDGTWFAYSSTESGPYEVYARRMDMNSPPIRISRRGELPRFSPAGDGVYYRDGTRWYFVAFTGDEDEPFANPQFVLEGEYQNVAGAEYDVSLDGRRLLVLERTAASSTTTLSLILNWRQELEAQLGK